VSSSVSARHAALLEEQERTLGALEDGLDRMIVKSRGVSHELDRQNAMLDGLSGQMGKAETGMRKAQRTMRTIH
jgi:hypothetical protein